MVGNMKTVLLAVAALALLGCRQGPPEPPKHTGSGAVPVTVAQVQLVPMDQTVPVVGTLYAKDESTLAAEVEGRVEKTLVDIGDLVTNGQLLAQIDTQTYVVLAQQAAANLARARASATNAAQNLRRIQTLERERAAAESELDQAMAAHAQALAEVRAAEAAEAVAKLNLERSQVKAPFPAAISERLVSAGDYVKAGSPLFRLVDDTQLKYEVQVPERYAAQVAKGQEVVFNVDAFPGQSFTGRVYLISPQIDPATRNLTFAALVDNQDRKLRASSFARGEWILARQVPTPVVPLDAVISFAGITRVFVISNQTAYRREVRIGRLRDGKQEVLSGLKAGEMVAVTGLSKLFEGAQVRPPKQ